MCRDARARRDVKKNDLNCIIFASTHKGSVLPFQVIGGRKMAALIQDQPVGDPETDVKDAEWSRRD